MPCCHSRMPQAATRSCRQAAAARPPLPRRCRRRRRPPACRRLRSPLPAQPTPDRSRNVLQGTRDLSDSRQNNPKGLGRLRPRRAAGACLAIPTGFGMTCSTARAQLGATAGVGSRTPEMRVSFLGEEEGAELVLTSSLACSHLAASTQPTCSPCCPRRPSLARACRRAPCGELSPPLPPPAAPSSKYSIPGSSGAAGRREPAPRRPSHCSPNASSPHPACGPWRACCAAG